MKTNEAQRYTIKGEQYQYYEAVFRKIKLYFLAAFFWGYFFKLMDELGMDKGMRVSNMGERSKTFCGLDR